MTKVKANVPWMMILAVLLATGGVCALLPPHTSVTVMAEFFKFALLILIVDKAQRILTYLRGMMRQETCGECIHWNHRENDCDYVSTDAEGPEHDASGCSWFIRAKPDPGKLTVPGEE